VGQIQKEQWGTRLGVILAVAGSAVGLGNFLRFPGLAAKYGGGAFMIPYFVALLLIGIPICWCEWTLGRYGGNRGFNSAPGIFRVLTRKGNSAYYGVLAIIVPLVIYMYYVFIESWCLAYAWYYLVGSVPADTGTDTRPYIDFFSKYVGMNENG
jgi:SNF family Na+-dependent transporter